MHPQMALDLVAQHVEETQTAVTAARLTSSVRAARRSAAAPQAHRRWILRRA
jgi:hypothetical protein